MGGKAKFDKRGRKREKGENHSYGSEKKSLSTPASFQTRFISFSETLSNQSLAIKGMQWEYCIF